MDPKDAQAWFLFGRALLSTIETKQEDNVITSAFPPGAAEAFQKCIDADPNGLTPHRRKRCSAAKSLMQHLKIDGFKSGGFRN